MDKYVVTDTESLRQLCMKNNWFTAGSVDQYLKLFDANRDNFDVREIAMFIYACSSDVSYSSVLGELRKERNAYRERMQKTVQVHMEQSDDASTRNNCTLDNLEVGDKVRVYMKYYDRSIPKYLDGCILTVLGFTPGGNVKCDYDGGTPFYIAPGLLEKMEKKPELQENDRRNTR